MDGSTHSNSATTKFRPPVATRTLRPPVATRTLRPRARAVIRRSSRANPKPTPRIRPSNPSLRPSFRCLRRKKPTLRAAHPTAQLRGTRCSCLGRAARRGGCRRPAVHHADARRGRAVWRAGRGSRRHLCRRRLGHGRGASSHAEGRANQLPRSHVSRGRATPRASPRGVAPVGERLGSLTSARPPQRAGGTEGRWT